MSLATEWTQSEPDGGSPMTRDEARQCVERINHHLDEARALLLDLYEREGWCALGYASWRECVAGEFPQWRQSYLYYQLEAARTERELSTIVETATLPPLREYHLRQIARLAPEQRVEVARAIVQDPQAPTAALRAIKRAADATLKTRPAPADRRYAPPPITIRPVDPEEIVQANAAALPASWTGIADLVLTSPPYGLDVAYANDVPDPSDYSLYSELRRGWCAELYRITHPEHGRACVNVPIDVAGRSGRSHQEISPRPIYADWLHDLLAVGFQYRATILWWDNNGGLGAGRGTPDPSAIHTYAPAEAIIVVYRGQGWKRIQDDPRDHDLGHDDWLALAGPRGCWTFPGVSDPCHPAPFPEELVRRCLRLYTYRGDLVSDPFCGRGTTPAVAVGLGRRIRASDLSGDYIDLSRHRVAAARTEIRP